MAFSKARRLANLMSSASDTVPAAKVNTVIADDAIGVDQIANSINTAITANTAKVTNAITTHTGDVTGGAALTIAVDAVDIPMLSASGTANNTTFLRGDNAWASVPAGVDIQSSAPSVASEGSLYYNTTTNLLYASDGTAWQVVGNFAPVATGGTITIPPQGGNSSFTYNLGLNFADADTPDGSLAYTLASGTLPAGASLPSSGNSALTGTVTNTAATYNWVIRATDTQGASSTQAYTQVITLQTISIAYLVIAGGGSGGKQGFGAGGAGGGGAGGHVTGTAQISASTGTVVVVGAGGANHGATGSTAGGAAQGNNGVSSTIAGVSTNSVGGGGGGRGDWPTIYNGSSGGSGGGSTGADSPVSAAVGGAGTSGQGNAGGAGAKHAPLVAGYGGGGGGGAGTAGVRASVNKGGNGGQGTNVYAAWASATSTGDGGYYMGGGGACAYNVANGHGLGTAGGGGDAGISNSGGTTSTDAQPGDVNTGSGGGATGHRSGQGVTGAGGSGLVIIRYAGSTAASGGTITSSGGNTYHTFTSSGTFTPS